MWGSEAKPKISIFTKITVLRQRRCGCSLDGVWNAGRSKVLFDLVPSCFPKMSKAKGIDDLKQRLWTASLTPPPSIPKTGHCQVKSLEADAYHLRQSSFSALFSACPRISAGVPAYRSDMNLFSTVTK